MTDAQPAAREPDTQLRVLALLPTARDSELTVDVLGRDGFVVAPCRSDAELARELARGAGAVLIAEELLGPDGAHHALLDHIASQPSWSDLPVLLLTGAGANSPTVKGALGLLGNVTLLERPMRVSALVSTVHAALRARARQYELARQLAGLEEARKVAALEARRKDEFLAMLAHELRNPLAPIRNALHVLALDDSDVARRRSLRAMMLRQVDHMVRLVSDLVEASRLSQGKIELQRQAIDLRDALRDGIDQAQPQAQAGRQALEVALGDEPLPMRGDPVRLAQVFGNLINNAAKYGRPGGRIRVSARREDDAAVVSVADDGNGIAPELLPRIFELFIQGSQREGQRMPEGLGIGLALVRSLVEMHGGRVDAFSEGRDRGAEFMVRLPLEACEVPPPAPFVAPAPTTTTESLRVLVVDDNVDAAESLALLLDAMGFEQRVVHDAREALAVAMAFRPHVALLDIAMPGMDGFELARRLRAEPCHAGLVLAALTGLGGPEHQRAGVEAGFDHHFAKPPDIRQLSAMLEAVRKRRAALPVPAG